MTGDCVVSGLFLPLWEEVLSHSLHCVASSSFSLLKKEPNGPQGVGSVWAQYPSRISERHIMIEENSGRSEKRSSVSSASSDEKQRG